MRHDFLSLGSVQWAEGGLSYNAARTDYKCSKCGVNFSHHYHIEDNIYKAMENEGIDIDNCPDKDSTNAP